MCDVTPKFPPGNLTLGGTATSNYSYIPGTVTNTPSWTTATFSTPTVEVILKVRNPDAGSYKKIRFTVPAYSIIAGSPSLEERIIEKIKEQL